MKEIHAFNGFNYVQNYGKLKGTTIEHNIERPKDIFKFYSFSSNSVDAVTNGYLFASHPFDLNDTFDSTKFLMYASKKLDLVFYENLLKDILPEEQIIDFWDKDNVSEEFYGRSYIEYLWQVSTNLFGIISTSATEYNLLMWPHYTQENGFQLKFNSSKLEESIKNNLTADEDYLGFFPINYCKYLEPIDVSDYNAMYIPLYYITNVKSEKWKYEEEWRFVVGKQNMGIPNSKIGLNFHKDHFVRKENRFVKYDNKLIEEITVGHNYFNTKRFSIERLDIENFRVSVKPETENKEYENEIKFLDFVCENLSNNFFHCGRKYEIKDDKLILVPTKERLIVLKESPENYILTRTNEYRAFID